MHFVSEAMTNVSEALVIRPQLAPLSTSHDLSWLLDPWPVCAVNVCAMAD